jgi:hypothetical protein
MAMTADSLEKKIEALKKSVDTLVLIEVAKSGATRDQARRALGSLDNNEYSQISALFNSHKGKRIK